MSSNTLTKDIVDSSIRVVSDLSKKEYELKKARIEIQHENLTKQLKETEGFKNLQIGVKEDRIESLKKSNRDYIKQAKQGAVFLSINEFKGLVPLFARNLLFVGAQSGEGKSTLTANLAYEFLKQNKKVLVITNEEVPEDVLNRIICLTKGWAYHDHTAITESQQEEFDRLYPVLLQRMEVIDDNYNGVGGLTTTIEGIKAVLDSLKANEKKYDIVIVDYFQNISHSNKNPSMDSFQVLHEVGRLFDQFKNVYDAPVIMLGTLKSVKDSESTPFKERIEGRKSIYNFSTCCMEVRADKQNSVSEWSFHKSRFTKSIGKTVKTGFDKGRYVEYNNAFAKAIEAENNRKMLANIGVQDAQALKERMKAIGASNGEQ